MSLLLDIRGRPGPYALNKRAIPGLLQDKIGYPWFESNHQSAILCLTLNTEFDFLPYI